MIAEERAASERRAQGRRTISTQSPPASKAPRPHGTRLGLLSDERYRELLADF
jgi:hypothetical protein